MSNLPLFDAPKAISPVYRPDAELVLYQGDAGDFIDTLPDGTVKLIVTSPPYNLGKEYEDIVFEQFVWDLEHRGVSNIDIPVLILGVTA